MHNLMDRITSLERMLNPVTQAAPQRYRPHTTKELDSYMLQRHPVNFGSGKMTTMHNYFE